MQNEETQAQLRECIEKTKENAPRLSNAFPPTRQDITFLPCVMPFNSMRFISNETSITKDGSRLRCSLNREALENMMDDIRRLLL